MMSDKKHDAKSFTAKHSTAHIGNVLAQTPDSTTTFTVLIRRTVAKQ